MSEDQQQQSGGALSGVTDTVGGVTNKATGAIGLGGSGSKSGEGEPEHKMTPEQQASAKEAQDKGAKGVEPIKEGESDAEIAKRLIAIVDPGLQRLQPLLDMMNDNIDQINKKRERKEDIDQEAFVDKMKPLIEQASQVLNETLGGLKGADPEGKAQSKAKYKKANNEASPEENHLAESVTKLTEEVAKVIQKAKDAIKDLPKAKKDLSPLLGLLNDPLFQILSAVGLLLKGVLGLVANLLGVLKLDGLVNGILGGLGLDKLLDGLGLGGIFGKDKK